MTEGIDKNLFFQHVQCDYFPCHEGVAPERFNCLLCYCPLYALGPGCGGNFAYNERGVKDCSGCTVPHDGDAGVRLVRDRFGELSALANAGIGDTPAVRADPRTSGTA